MHKLVIYVVWGNEDRYEKMLARSVESVRRHCHNVTTVVHRCPPEHTSRGLSNKPQVINNLVDFRSDYDVALFLDADTVVLGNLDFAFDAASKHGIACCIGESPWLRRFDRDLGDAVEYNTGVIFFSQGGREVIKRWAELDPHYTGKTHGSVVDVGHGPIGLECDDQLSFGKAIRDCDFNPFVLPLNYNFRPGWHVRFMTPMKIWHSVHDVPSQLEDYSVRAEKGEVPTQMCTLANGVNPTRWGGM